MPPGRQQDGVRTHLEQVFGPAVKAGHPCLVPECRGSYPALCECIPWWAVSDRSVPTPGRPDGDVAPGLTQPWLFRPFPVGDLSVGLPLFAFLIEEKKGSAGECVGSTHTPHVFHAELEHLQNLLSDGSGASVQLLFHPEPRPSAAGNTRPAPKLFPSWYREEERQKERSFIL